jgi:hypothetical protein
MSKLVKTLQLLRNIEKYQISNVFTTMRDEQSIRTKFKIMEKKLYEYQKETNCSFIYIPDDKIQSINSSYEYQLYRDFIKLDKIRAHISRLESKPWWLPIGYINYD